MFSKQAKAKTTKKRPQQATSNVFAIFDQSQIQEFKEAFNMIDQNHDVFVNKKDLHDMLASLGKNPTDEYLEGMMSEKLKGTDLKDVIHNAFTCFDEEASGFIHEDHLWELLTTMNDHFTDEEVEEMYHEAPIDKKDNFNYVEFTCILKHGTKDKDDWATPALPQRPEPHPVTRSPHTLVCTSSMPTTAQAPRRGGSQWRQQVWEGAHGQLEANVPTETLET
uniref:EF-hand domain-containing protein n=1 Tax=Microcebus murinus TaxID=30608 RepID=A0A8C5XH01_MICMU